MPRVGLNGDAVVDAAFAVVDESGPQALTLATVAARVGVATPSLYQHVAGLAHLRARVAARVLTEMTAAATEAVVGRSGDDAVASLMRRMREYAVAHAHRFAAVPADPMHDPALAEPAEKFLRVFLAVLRGYDLSGPAAVHATRCLRVIVYGFAAIESSGGFGLAEDPAETYEHLIDMYLTSLH